MIYAYMYISPLLGPLDALHLYLIGRQRLRPYTSCVAYDTRYAIKIHTNLDYIPSDI